ncbi:MAG: hypothetical protein EOM26_06120 [Alphaproteobacteria bacterium]|nr:hypothetical protein [Alphaproteobacteria bacterium]
MSEVNGRDFRLVRTVSDVLPLYEGAGEANVRCGAELELCFFDPVTLRPMNSAQNEQLRALAPFDVHQEPGADTLEVLSAPQTLDDGRRVLAEIGEKAAFLTGTARSLGLKRCYFEFLPHVRPETLLADVVAAPRYQAFFVPVRPDMADIAAYFVQSKSAQISVSYSDLDHMLANVRRLYCLAPFLFMLCDNSPPFMNGDPAPVNHLPGMALRSALGNRGGIPPYLFTAATGEDYVRAHIEHVLRGPMFAYYDCNGSLVRLPDGQFTSFESLRFEGLNTAANYFLAESTLWPDVKIAALRDDSGNVNGHRFEARMFGSGSHQTATALAIVGGLACLPAFAGSVERLLKEYGFACDQPAATRGLLGDSYHAARMHGGRFFDVPFGLGRMRDFAERFGDILEDAYSAHPLGEAIAPALRICRTGRNDAAASRRHFRDLPSVLDFLANSPEEALAMGSCADVLLSDVEASRWKVPGKAAN